MKIPFRCGGCGDSFVGPTALKEHIQQAEGFHYCSSLYQPTEGALPIALAENPEKKGDYEGKGGWVNGISKLSMEDWQTLYRATKKEFETIR